MGEAVCEPVRCYVISVLGTRQMAVLVTIVGSIKVLLQFAYSGVVRLFYYNDMFSWPPFNLCTRNMWALCEL